MNFWSILEKKLRQDEERAQLKMLIQDLQSMCHL